jgi:hypothetical protein
MNPSTATRRQLQRDAIWKWRWLGLRDSTPGFKISLALIAGAIISLAVTIIHG